MSVYLKRYAFQKQYIDSQGYGMPGVIVVIPCHNEENLLESLDSLENCLAPTAEVTVITVINSSEIDSAEIKKRNTETFEKAIHWSRSKKWTYHFILENELPKKHAGVGLARKIGMDEAVRIFESNEKDGVIICFDADSECDENLLVEVEGLFSDPKVLGCSIYYEHPTSGSMDPRIYDGIVQYEIHLRYYIDALIYAGHPYAFQTIGSSLAVRSSVYQKQGGMNRRQAGEDFYFLHRIIPLGNFKNLNSTRIIPSPRKSDRVPFGTGKAIGDWLDTGDEQMQTYAPESFEELKIFFAGANSYCGLSESELNETYLKLSKCLKSFVSEEEFIQKINEVNQHSTTPETFQKRFFQWFDAFKVLKFVHHARDHFYPNISVYNASKWILEEVRMESKDYSQREILDALRKMDREEDYSILVANSPRK